MLFLFIIGIIIGTAIQSWMTHIKNLAQAIDDDRTAAIASDARALGEAGQELLSRTADLAAAALATGSVDADAAAQLRTDYEQQFAADADTLKRQGYSTILGSGPGQARTIETRITLLIHR